MFAISKFAYRALSCSLFACQLLLTPGTGRGRRRLFPPSSPAGRASPQAVGRRACVSARSSPPGKRSGRRRCGWPSSGAWTTCSWKTSRPRPGCRRDVQQLLRQQGRGDLRPDAGPVVPDRLLIVGNLDLQTGLPDPLGGTVTVTNGSTAVVGIGTHWLLDVPTTALRGSKPTSSTIDPLSLGYPPIQS